PRRIRRMSAAACCGPILVQRSGQRWLLPAQQIRTKRYADTRSLSVPDYMARDRAPSFYVQATQYGLQSAARRDTEADSSYWRTTQFLMPTSTMIPAPPGDPISDRSRAYR